MHIIPIHPLLALPNLEPHPLGEIGREIIPRPVNPILLGLQRPRRIPLDPMPILAARPVRRPDPPQLPPGALLDDRRVRLCHLARPHHDAVLHVLPEQPVRQHRQPVRARPDARDLDVRDARAGRDVQVAPVLVRLRVGGVVLEVDAGRRQDGERAAPRRGAVVAGRGQRDAAAPRAAAGGGHVVGDVRRDGVVEARVPGRVGEGQGFGAEGLQGGAGAPAVEVVVELVGGLVSGVRCVCAGRGVLTGPKVRSKPSVMLGVPLPWWFEAGAVVSGAVCWGVGEWSVTDVVVDDAVDREIGILGPVEVRVDAVHDQPGSEGVIGVAGAAV